MNQRQRRAAVRRRHGLGKAQRVLIVTIVAGRQVEVVAELKVLTRDQDSLIQSQTRLVNQLTACLKAYYPVALDLFGKLHQPSTLAFLQAFPTPQEAQAATTEQIGAVLKAAGHPQATTKAAQIWQRLHQPHLQTDPVLTRAKARLMLTRDAEHVAEGLVPL